MAIKSSRNIRVDLEANQSLSVEIPLDETNPAEPMFAKLWLWVRESGKLAKMSGAAAKVYIALATRADFTTLDCFPSTALIAADAGLSRRAVFDGLEQLATLGLVMKASGIRNGAGGENEANRYQIVRPPLVQKMHKGYVKPAQGLCKNETGPYADIAHKLEKENKNQLTTAAEAGCEANVGGQEEWERAGGDGPAPTRFSPDKDGEVIRKLADYFYSQRRQRLSKPRPAVEVWLTERLAVWEPATIKAAIDAADWADDPAGVDRVLSNLPDRLERARQRAARVLPVKQAEPSRRPQPLSEEENQRRLELLRQTWQGARGGLD